MTILLVATICSRAQDTLRIEDTYVKDDVDPYVASIDDNIEVVVLYGNFYISKLTESFEDGSSTQIFHAGRDTITSTHYYKDGSIQDITIQVEGAEYYKGWFEKKHGLKDSLVTKGNHRYWKNYTVKGKMNFIFIDDSIGGNMYYQQAYSPNYSMITSTFADSVITRVWDSSDKKLLERKQNGAATIIKSFSLYGKNEELIFLFIGTTESEVKLVEYGKAVRKWLNRHDPLEYLFMSDNLEQELEIELVPGDE